MADIFTGLQTYIGGIFGAVTTLITNIGTDGILSAFMWYLPLTSVALGLIFKIVGKRRGGRRR